PLKRAPDVVVRADGVQAPSNSPAPASRTRILPRARCRLISFAPPLNRRPRGPPVGQSAEAPGRRLIGFLNEHPMFVNLLVRCPNANICRFIPPLLAVAVSNASQSQ